MQKTAVNFDYQVYLVTIIYFAVFSLIRDGLSFDLPRLTFLLGVISSLPFISAVEAFLYLKTSIYRSFIFQFILLIVVVFALTSSINNFGKGLVLSLFLSQLIIQAKQFMKEGNIASWFGKDGQNLSITSQRIYFTALVLIYVSISIYLL